MAEQDPRPHLNFALVEDTRPPMYTAMKYWGKKPHNIWSQFIERYCPPGGTVLDPFAGSAIAAFESAKIGRNTIAFDLNPLTAFIIEVLTSKLDEVAFLGVFKKITNSIENDPIYVKHYTKELKGQRGTIFNYRWDAGEVESLAVEIQSGKETKSGKVKKGKRYFIKADDVDKKNARSMRDLSIPYWYPADELRVSRILCKRVFV